MRRERCPGKRVDKGVDGVFVFACALAIAVAAASVAGGLSGCIRVSPHFEVVDCVERFMDAAAAGDFWTVKDLTVDRPEGWERAIEAVAPAWSRWETVDVERSGDRALVRIVSETGASAFGVGVSVTGGGAIDFDNQTSAVDDEASEIGDEMSVVDDEASAVATRAPNRRVWVIELVRIEGVWFVDLNRTLAPE